MLRKAIRAIVLWAFLPTKAEMEAAFDAALRLAIQESTTHAPLIGRDVERRKYH